MKKYRIELKWALIFVGMMLTWMLLERLSGLHDEHISQHEVYTNFVAIPAIAVYVFALLDKRKNFYKGSMTYMQGLISGLVITLIVSLISPATQYITSAIISPNYFQNVIAYAVSTGKMTQEAAEAYFNLKNYLIQTVIFTPIMGVMTAAVVAIFTRRKGTQALAPESAAS
ncbi:MAG: DUF4199 domain-containing protein [Hymenobacteraceae bacterium]|nr:DUF4199 domain-containing protein [Hymenobacteraceae bacterium]MDX5511217.1 DUF4199 domain-containing protein [Hymenobacteraceae bacterium]